MYKAVTFFARALLVAVFLTGCDKADKTASEPSRSKSKSRRLPGPPSSSK